MKQKTISQLKKLCWDICSLYYRKKYPVCQICEKRKSDVVHHIVKRSISNFLYFDPINLLALCSTCHNKLHPQNRNRISFDDTEYAIILSCIIGQSGIEYLEDNKHNVKNDVAYELKDMIQHFKQAIKDIT